MAVAGLIAALACPAAARDVVLVVDRSRSAAGGGADPGGHLVRAALWLVRGEPTDRLFLLNAGEGVTLAPPRRGGDWGLLAETLSAPEQRSSDLLTALEQAAALLRSRDGVCVLISDGELDVVGRGGAVPEELAERLGPAALGSRVAINRAALDLLARGALATLAASPERLVFIELPLPPAARFASLGDAASRAGVARIDGADAAAAAAALLTALEPTLRVVRPEGGRLSLGEVAGARVRLLVADGAWAPPAEVLSERQSGTWRVIELAAAPTELPVPPEVVALAVVQRAGGVQGDAWFVEPDAGGPAVRARAQLGAAVEGPAGAVVLRATLGEREATSAPASGGPIALTLPVEGAAVGAEVHLAVLDGQGRALAGGTVVVRSRAGVSVEPVGPVVADAPVEFAAATPAGRALGAIELLLRDEAGAVVAVALAPVAGGHRGALPAGLRAGAYALDPGGGVEAGLRFAWASRLGAGDALVVAPAADASLPPARVVLAGVEDRPLAQPAAVSLHAAGGIAGVGTLELRVELDPERRPAPPLTIAWPGAPPGAGARFGQGALADGRPARLVVRSPSRAQRRILLRVGAEGVAATATLTLALAAAPEGSLATDADPSGLGGWLLGALLLGALGWVGWGLTPVLRRQQLRALGPGGTAAQPEVAQYLKAHRRLGRSVSLPVATPPLAVGVSGAGVVARARPGATVFQPGGEGRALDRAVRLTHGAVVLVGEQPWVFLVRDPNPDEVGCVWWPPGLGERQLRKLSEDGGHAEDGARLLRDHCAPRSSPVLPIADPPLELTLVGGDVRARGHPEIEIESGDAPPTPLRDGRALVTGDRLHVGPEVWVYLDGCPAPSDEARPSPA